MRLRVSQIERVASSLSFRGYYIDMCPVNAIGSYEETLLCEVYSSVLRC